MNEERVVKCVSCEKFFGFSEENTACPFCNTPYKAAEVKVPEKPKEKKLTVKTQKESFKIWKDGEDQ